mmetsp:Transcript_8011/g.20100  ORF Transcript_8011/g.20100 Transcript_8011/m.20100 type:complete len:119 (+) Transcript_8011:954-1310(+)
MSVHRYNLIPTKKYGYGSMCMLMVNIVSSMLGMQTATRQVVLRAAEGICMSVDVVHRTNDSKQAFIIRHEQFMWLEAYHAFQYRLRSVLPCRTAVVGLEVNHLFEDTIMRNITPNLTE